MIILGVRVDTVTKDEALARAKRFLVGDTGALLFTPNPEMLVKAEHDPYFKKILNQGNLNVCDGMGLYLASFERLKRLPGVDFMISLCALATAEGKSVYLLGSGSDDVVAKTAEKLRQDFPALKISGFNKGPAIRENKNFELVIDEAENKALITQLNEAKPDILFVAFGMGKQEKWLAEYLAKCTTVKIGMGVGGAFDFISGRATRAPLLMRQLGLEWLYRLLREPKRFVRIFNATVRFTLLLLVSFISFKK